MKRDVKVGLLVAAVVCGVTAILLGGGLVGENPGSGSALLQVDGGSASLPLQSLPDGLSDAIAPPAELEPRLSEDVDFADVESVEASIADDDPEIAEDEVVALAVDSLPRLAFSDEVVLPGATDPDTDVEVGEHPEDWSTVAPGVADPAEPVDVEVPDEAEVPVIDESAWEDAVASASVDEVPEADVAPPASGVSAPLAPTRFYVVQEGDSFFTISKRLFGTVRYFPDLQKANPDINPRRLRKGMAIAVPTITGASPRKELLVGEQAAKPKTPTVFLAQDKIHVIQPGEVLEEISYKYYGKRQKWRHIVDANPGLNPRTIRPGMRIVIPALTE
jgi:nucleoid-associated protein YgaU